MENCILTVPAARTIPVQAYTQTAFTEAFVPEGVKVIEPKAFQYCSSLKCLHLPRSLQYIELKAFEGCPLEDIFFSGTPAEWEQVEISPVKNNAVLVARKHFALPGEAALRTSRMDRSPKIYAQARALLENGGDGRLHVFVPELMIPGNYFKYGDLILLIFPHGSTMVIDAGRGDCHTRAESFLDATGVRSLDYLVFSHGCTDHVSGGPMLIKHIWNRGGKVRHLWWTGQKYSDEIPKMFEMLREQGAETDDAVHAGRSFEIDGAKIDILGPTEEELQGDANKGKIRNGQSMILRVTVGKGIFLTCGDLFEQHEKKVIERCGRELHADLMKTNHHGGYTSNESKWLDAVQPRMAFSCSNDNGCIRLVEELQRRGVDYTSTGCQGLLHFALSGDGEIEKMTQYDEMINIMRVN